MIAHFCILLAAEAPAPQALLEAAIVAGRERLAERSRYLAREDVRVYRERHGARKQTRWTTYEAAIVDGRIRYRRVARDGKPLQPREQTLEPETQRYAMRLEQIVEHHELRVVGEETIQGRPAWHVEARLRPQAPVPMARGDLALLGSWDIWIDRATSQECRGRLRVERLWGVWKPGATVEHWFEFQGRLFLPVKSVVRRMEKNEVIETEQVLSGYRRFSGEAVLIDTTP